ncbi:taurine catabolism dioxygenase family protein [Grosmannia clavigera kw1407]|uniref:Taurine catabolism dioxygenase family protein n=1 Tax=Grosmannia clavigera (strain kw1407 / UAMH 11150) TaxID=655863 RepID=F0XQF1_GROCL|nr:taurine catabolism dioxygenase family protein [Grosmannia clavigera kw1407]EFX00080.1 taurine catabolism dioxygenase family protein [Grosmannia clavigera kw1407]
MTEVLPYELYSDAPGTLFVKHEWEEANAAHPAGHDFGDVPAGWPKRLEGPLAWDGKDLQVHPEKFVTVLTAGQIAEIDAASKSFAKLSLPLSAVNRSNFPLPTVSKLLRGVAHNIYKGTGLNLLRGFPIQNYDKEEQIRIFLGINSWVGDERLSQGIGRGVCHIKSITHLDPSIRGKVFVSAQDTNAQMYHSDAGSDVVSLMALSLPESGGESTVASSWQVYNHLAQHRPDILRVLAERKFRWKAVGIPDTGVNLLHWLNEQLYLNFSTRTFIGYGELPERDLSYPALTLEEREAFGGWQWIAEQYSLETALQIGDIEWVNNLHHQHARRGFTEDVSKPRHLLRVWLRDNELSPVLPTDIKNKFDPMFNIAPDFYPLDEIEEDERRKQTGVFTASCDEDTAAERLEKGIMIANR